MSKRKHQRGRWARLMGSVWRHPKFAGLDPEAIALWTMALSWSIDNKTDGLIPEHIVTMLRSLLDHPVTMPRPRAVRMLTRRNLWDRTPDGYGIHNFFEYQEPAKALDTLSDMRSKLGKLGMEKRWGPLRTSDSNSYSKPITDSDSDSDSKKNPPTPQTGASVVKLKPKQTYCPAARHAGKGHMQPHDMTVDPPVCRDCENAERPKSPQGLFGR